MLWCFFYLKGLTVWLCFMVYFGFMCIKHAMIWLQLKGLRWSSPWVCLIWKNLPFIPAEFIFGTICLDLWYCEFSILKIAIFVMSDVYLLCLFLQVKFQTFKAGALLTLMLLWSDCQLFHCLVCLYVLGMAVQIIKIWKWKENVWRKTCCTWG